jgi:acyl carrier protein
VLSPALWAEVTEGLMTELEQVVATVLELPRAAVDEQRGVANTAVWTSLRHVQLIVQLNKVYGVDISAREARRLRSVGQIRTFLRAAGIKT